MELFQHQWVNFLHMESSPHIHTHPQLHLRVQRDCRNAGASQSKYIEGSALSKKTKLSLEYRLKLLHRQQSTIFHWIKSANTYTLIHTITCIYLSAVVQNDSSKISTSWVIFSIAWLMCANTASIASEEWRVHLQRKQSFTNLNQY